MRIGVVYPQTEYGSDPKAIQEYARRAEALGYQHIVAYDHVLGANPERPGGWKGPYTYQHAFHEPFVLFSFMAAVTHSISFATAILILPQRETALVAKQAATLDTLSGGRFRLGVGIGWNEVEYIGLNQNFHARGKRIEEQVALLRRLWTEELVTFTGEWHTVPDAGIEPRPARPIPIWFGGQADAVLRRIAALGDGWFINYRDPAAARPDIEKLQRYRLEAGGSLDTLGMDARIHYGDGDSSRWRALLEQWREAGVSDISFNTMGAGLTTPAAHLGALGKFAREAGVS